MIDISVKDLDLSNTRAIVGFSEVQKDPNKLWVWMVEKIKSFETNDIYYLAKDGNEIPDRTYWAKQAMTKSKIIEYWGGQSGLSMDTLNTFTHNYKTGDGNIRNFIKFTIPNPYNNKIPANDCHIQIIQSKNPPFDLMTRAVSEASANNKEVYEMYLEFVEKAKKKTYIKSYTEEYELVDCLVEVYVEENNKKYCVFEETVIRVDLQDMPIHRLVDYKVPSSLAPVEINEGMIIKNKTQVIHNNNDSYVRVQNLFSRG